MTEYTVTTKNEYAAQLAREIIGKFAPVYFVERDEIFIPKEGLLEPNGEAIIRAEIEKEAKEENTIGFYNLVLHHIKSAVPKRAADFIQPSGLINVKNGILDVDSGEFFNHNPNTQFLERFPITYDSSARCPEFLRVFKQIVPDSDMRFEILAKFAGTFDKTPQKREAELWIGPPDSGKTTLLNVLRVMQGNNASANSLYQLTDPSDKFSSSHLFNKFTNIYDDLPSIEIKEAGSFKALMGGGVIPAQFKGKDHFDFAPFTKLFFACNTPPTLQDDKILLDEAFLERFKIRFFTERFNNENRDETLTNVLNPDEGKITKQEEISGLFNILIGILRSMRQYRDFIYRFNTKETKALWLSAQANTETVSRFLNEKVIVKEGSSLPVNELWETWEIWRREKQFNAISRIDFNQRIEKISSQSHNNKIRIWRDICFKDDNQTTFEDTIGKTIGRNGLYGLFQLPFEKCRKQVKVRYRKPVQSVPYYRSNYSNDPFDSGVLRTWFSNPLSGCNYVDERERFLSQYTTLRNGILQCGFCSIYKVDIAAIRQHILAEHMPPT